MKKITYACCVAGYYTILIIVINAYVAALMIISLMKPHIVLESSMGVEDFSGYLCIGCVHICPDCVVMHLVNCSVDSVCD